MAAKKKSKKKSPAKKIQTQKKASKKPVKKKAFRKKLAAKRSVTARIGKASKKQVRTKKPTFDSASGSRKIGSLSGDADSQGLSDVERADSESVGELLEEGNTFEAGVVSGVEQADDADEKEVRTREFPEDDVPDEYLDRD
jgi:hypothetical protein